MSPRYLSALLALTLAAPLAAAESRAIQAQGPWVAEGKAYRTGDDRLLFVGAFSGVMVLESETGGKQEMDAAEFVCPGTQEVDYAAQRAEASGRCIFETSGGGRVFARWSCEGEIGDCRGRIELIAGTGALEGIGGGGPMRLRAFFADVEEDDDGVTIVDKAVGLVTWPLLEYRLPDQ